MGNISTYLSIFEDTAGVLSMGVACSALFSADVRCTDDVTTFKGLGHFMGIDTHDVGGYPKVRSK